MALRSTQNTIEAAVTGSPAMRATQNSIEPAINPAAVPLCRATQVVIEVAIKPGARHTILSAGYPSMISGVRRIPGLSKGSAR